MGKENGVERIIGQLQGNLNGIANDIGVIRADMAHLRQNFDDLEKGRLSAVESRLSYLYGIIALGGVILPIAITFLMNKFLGS